MFNFVECKITILLIGYYKDEGGLFCGTLPHEKIVVAPLLYISEALFIGPEYKMRGRKATKSRKKQKIVKNCEPCRNDGKGDSKRPCERKTYKNKKTILINPSISIFEYTIYQKFLFGQIGKNKR